MTYLSDDAALIRGNLPASAQPPSDADALFLLYAVLMRAKGEQVTASDVHDAWAAWQQSLNPEHPALVPFRELAPAVQDEDEPYVAAIHAATRILAAQSRV
ncbi:DUF7701 domain-containing protein [Streptacidiphilus anmyonensis]|uniref:DUF7701 domain-containing protein n=1 Tax=Streptacidiphilus anmyonensis TaxID=405782 RepID=UPI0005A76CF7|nr:hypothetical protein [Streptacidiphilus anmyonensis]